MKQSIIQVDAFTSEAFRGNPAAVCILESERDDKWMRNVALEMNLSETVYLTPIGANHYRIRWFTPVTEVDLCGHATLASAYVLYSDGFCDTKERIKFESRSGPLFAKKNRDWIELDFPSTPPEPKEISETVIQALGVAAIFRRSGRTVFDDFIEVDSEESLKKIKPDFLRLSSQEDSRGFIVTAKGTGRYDFVSRYFAPSVGVPEDPVTGSIHCALTPYWAAKLGKSEMLAFQASKRGGELLVKMAGDRVLIAGKAVITMRGDILV